MGFQGLCQRNLKLSPLSSNPRAAPANFFAPRLPQALVHWTKRSQCEGSCKVIFNFISSVWNRLNLLASHSWIMWCGRHPLRVFRGFLQSTLDRSKSLYGYVVSVMAPQVKIGKEIK